MNSDTFEAPVPFDQVHHVFSDRHVLDAVHGRGMWAFRDWMPNDDGSYTRQGDIKGVEVPVFVRALNHGKKHVVCHVTQRYSADCDSVVISSEMYPKLLGRDMAHNSSMITIYPHGDQCIVRVSYRNTTSLPHPLSAMAVDVMNDMSKETIDFLRDALAIRKNYIDRG